VDAPTVTVRVEALPEVTDDGLKTAEVPAGRFPYVSVIVSELPLVVCVLTTKVAFPPWLTDTNVGVACMEKLSPLPSTIGPAA
jgi:hypothetical protein